MTIDQPVTVYKKDRKDMKNGGHTASEMQKIASDWEKKYGKPGKASKKISLSEFMAGNRKDNNK